MIRMTRQADYGIILLGSFVNDSDKKTYNARDLAAATRLPLPMVGKTLKGLVRAGFLASHRGVKGGYSLARSPEEISVAAIITALDGPIGLTVCSAHGGDCGYETLCPARINWHKINDAVLAALEGISLADMVHGRASFGALPGARRTGTGAPRALDPRGTPRPGETP